MAAIRAPADAETGRRRETRLRMRNDRFRGKRVLALIIVGGGVAYLAIVLAFTVAFGDTVPLLGWIGFAVVAAVVLGASVVLALFLVRSSTHAGERPSTVRPAAPSEVRRVLVILDETCPVDGLCRSLLARTRGRELEAYVVAPALVSPVHYLDSDVDAAAGAARGRLDATLAAFESTGIRARGAVGSENPLEAISDALVTFPADEVVIATPPTVTSNWLERGIVTRAQALLEQPVTHLVVQSEPLATEIPTG
jgi:hypothetical protein